MIFIWRSVNIFPSTLPSSASKGLIQSFTVCTETYHRAANCSNVIGWSGSFILDDLEGVGLFQRAKIQVI